MARLWISSDSNNRVWVKETHLNPWYQTFTLAHVSMVSKWISWLFQAYVMESIQRQEQVLRATEGVVNLFCQMDISIGLNQIFDVQ